MSGTNPVLQETSRSNRHSYHGSRPFGLITLSLVAITLGGCSASLPSLFGDDGKSAQVARSENVKPEPNVTGSLALSNSAKSKMSPLDWNIAKSALRETLGRGEAGASQPWENPTSGARGTVTPIASIYEKNGFACRNFIVSHVRESKESWFEGTACRVHRGQWDVTNTRPLEKS